MDDLQLYALNTGMSACPAHLVFCDGNPRQSVPMAWAFYLLRSGSRRILIDTGLNDERKAAEFGVATVGNAPGLLEKLGIAPEEITHIVISHHHFDHTGAIDCFPAATVIMEERQYPEYRKECPEHPPVSPERLQLFRDGCRFDILELRRSGRHTAGSVEISFRFRGRLHMFTGDECYCRRNYQERLPIGYAENPEINSRYIRQMPGNVTLLPFHDPEIFTSHAQAGSPAVVRIL